MHQSFENPAPHPPKMGNTRGKPVVFTLFLLDLGSSVVGEYIHLFSRLRYVECGGWAGDLAGISLMVRDFF